MASEPKSSPEKKNRKTLLKQRAAYIKERVALEEKRIELDLKISVLTNQIVTSQSPVADPITGLNDCPKPRT